MFLALQKAKNTRAWSGNMKMVRLEKTLPGLLED
jgi:hypothetical protein